MNSIVVISLISLGALLWLFAVLRERFKSTFDGTIFTFLKQSIDGKGTTNIVASPVESSAEVTIDALERELGIEPDHYLCDRIARINEALVARRGKSSKKKGGAQ